MVALHLVNQYDVYKLFRFMVIVQTIYIFFFLRKPRCCLLYVYTMFSTYCRLFTECQIIKLFNSKKPKSTRLHLIKKN